MIPAEVAPAVPALLELLQSLAPLAGFVVALGGIVVMDKLVGGVLGVIASAVGHVPLVGGYLQRQVDDAKQVFNTNMGDAAFSLSQHMTRYLGDLSTLVHRWANWIEWAGKVDLAIVEHIGGEIAKGAKATLHKAEGVSRSNIQGEVKTLRRDISTAKHEAIHAADAAVLPRLRSLEHDFGYTIPHDIADLRSWAKTRLDSLDQLWNRIKAFGWVNDSVTFAGAVAVALTALGLGGLRCSAFRRLLNRPNCGFGTALEDLFGLLLDAVILVDLCEVIPEATAIFATVEAPLTSLISTAADAACARPPGGWAALHVAPGPLPPPQTLGAFGG
ncbi:MAG: hypothetical protein ACRDUT_00045 [Mycobacterium sp.]